MSRALRILATLIAVAAATAVLLTGLAAGADASRTAVLGSPAHSGSEARHYRSAVSQIVPAVPGLSVSVQVGGTLTLTNTTGRTVTVLGYASEPYLRISAHGVDENLNSISSGVNAAAGDVRGLAAIGTGPAETGAKPSTPRWQHRDDSSTVVWRDYRTRGPVSGRPPVVRADPHHQHRVSTWNLRLTVDGEPVTVQGTLDWTGVPRFTPRQFALLIIGAVVVLGVAILIIAQLIDLRSERRAEREEAAREAERQPDAGRPTRSPALTTVA